MCARLFLASKACHLTLPAPCLLLLQEADFLETLPRGLQKQQRASLLSSHSIKQASSSLYSLKAESLPSAINQATWHADTIKKVKGQVQFYQWHKLLLY